MVRLVEKTVATKFGEIGSTDSCVVASWNRNTVAVSLACPAAHIQVQSTVACVAFW